MMAVTFENVDRIVSSANNVIDLNNLSAGGAEKYTATGSIGAGQTVGLRSDGTVEVVAGVTETFTNSAGTPVVFRNYSTGFISATFDSNTNTVVIAYQDNGGGSNYGKAVVGTVAGNSITFGTPVVFESGYTTDISATFDSNSNKVFITYQDLSNSNWGTAVVGTVSGNSITFGSPVVFNGNGTLYTSAAFDSNSNKVVIAFGDGSNAYGKAIVGTVSGNSITFGTPVIFESAETEGISATFNSKSNKVVIAYTDYGNSRYGTAVVGTVSGTSISFGTPVVFKNDKVYQMSATSDPNSNKVVIAFQDDVPSKYGTAVVGIVSGNSISFGGLAVFKSSYTAYMSATFDSNTNKVVIAYQDYYNSQYGNVVVGTLSGAWISFGTPVVFESGGVKDISATFDSNSNKVVIAYHDSANSGFGTATVFQAEGTANTTNADTWLGIAGESVNSSEAVSIKTVGGVVSGLSGLTIGSEYYVNYDGTLVATENAGVSNGTYGKIGKAISSSKLLITETN